MTSENHIPIRDNNLEIASKTGSLTRIMPPSVIRRASLIGQVSFFFERIDFRHGDSRIIEDTEHLIDFGVLDVLLKWILFIENPIQI